MLACVPGGRARAREGERKRERERERKKASIVSPSSFDLLSNTRFDEQKKKQDGAFDAYPSSIHFGGGGPSERSFLPLGDDRGGGRHRLHRGGGTAKFPGGGGGGQEQQLQGRRLAAAVRADGDFPARSAALGSLFCEEEDVRSGGGGAAAAVAAVQAKEGKDKDKGKGKK